jgi:hypothetical protein
MAGVEYEGESPPQRTEEDDQAIRAWNLMSDGNGGVRWDALDLAVQMYDVADVPGLVQRLVIIKTHRPPEKPDGNRDPNS